MRRGVLIVIVLALFGLLLYASGAWLFVWNGVEQTASLAHIRYGINVSIALVAFAVGEGAFIGSIAMMLREAGSRVSWGDIRSFKIRDLELGSSRMTWWLWVNRASWIAPWLVVILMSLGRVPWWATLAALSEVAATAGVGILLTLGLRLPWWNRPKGQVDGQEA